MAKADTNDLLDIVAGLDVEVRAELEALDDDALLRRLDGLTVNIADTKDALDSMYEEQKGIFAVLRLRTDDEGRPRVVNRRIAEAARISEEAVIQRLRPKKAAKKAAAR